MFQQRATRQNIAQENSNVLGGKQMGGENVPQKKGLGIVTRSRAALGEIQNVIHPSDKQGSAGVGLKKPGLSLKENVPTQKPKGKPIFTKKDSPAGSKDNDMHQDDMDVEAVDEQNQTLTSPSPPVICAADYPLVRAMLREKMSSETDVAEFNFMDVEDIPNSQMLSEYVVDIFDYLQCREMTVVPMRPDYLSPKSTITSRMRYILVDWLIQVHEKYNLFPETLHLTVALIDRYLQAKCEVLDKANLQLLGITALYTASKYEEMYPPDLSDFVYVTDNAYDGRKIRFFEMDLLETIEFNMSIPLAIVFLRRYSRVSEVEARVHNMGKYLVELTLAEYDLSSVLGSVRAASALCLARVLDKGFTLEEAWTPTLQWHSGYTLNQLKAAIYAIAKTAFRQNAPSKCRAIHTKYSKSSKFMGVATWPELQSDLIQELAALADQ